MAIPSRTSQLNLDATGTIINGTLDIQTVSIFNQRHDAGELDFHAGEQWSFVDRRGDEFNGGSWRCEYGELQRPSLDDYRLRRRARPAGIVKLVTPTALGPTLKRRRFSPGLWI